MTPDELMDKIENYPLKLCVDWQKLRAQVTALEADRDEAQRYAATCQEARNAAVDAFADANADRDRLKSCIENLTEQLVKTVALGDRYKAMWEGEHAPEPRHTDGRDARCQCHVYETCQYCRPTFTPDAKLFAADALEQATLEASDMLRAEFDVVKRATAYIKQRLHASGISWAVVGEADLRTLLAILNGEEL